MEPLTNYFVGRVKKELRAGATTVGGIVTSTVRALGGDTVLTDRLRSSAHAVGLDWSHSWSNRVYRWRGTLMASDVRGSPEAIAATQRSPTHYGQRPDRDVTSDGLLSTHFDSTATVMRGYGLCTRLAKENGNWLWEVQQNWRSPGFEVNDLSIIGRTDYRLMNAKLARQWVTPGRFYRSAFLSFGGQQQFDYSGLRTNLEQYAFNSIEFPNYWVMRAYWERTHSAEHDRLSRGGPLLGAVGSDYHQLGISTDPRGRTVWNVQNGVGVGFDGTKTSSFTPGVAVKPAGNVIMQIPNLTSRSLRGTAMLRWEYRPGSTMYFVWTQQRSGADAFGDLDFPRDARALVTDRPDNVFLIKATYWLGR